MNNSPTPNGAAAHILPPVRCRVHQPGMSAAMRGSAGISDRAEDRLLIRKCVWMSANRASTRGKSRSLLARLPITAVNRRWRVRTGPMLRVDERVPRFVGGSQTSRRNRRQTVQRRSTPRRRGCSDCRHDAVATTLLCPNTSRRRRRESHASHDSSAWHSAMPKLAVIRPAGEKSCSVRDVRICSASN